MHRLEPIIEHDYTEIRLTRRFEEVIRFADSPNNGEYKKKLFGNNPIKKAPADYYMVNTILDMEMVEIWDDLSMSDKGKFIAARQLKNMADVVGRHNELQEEELKGTST